MLTNREKKEGGTDVIIGSKQTGWGQKRPDFRGKEMRERRGGEGEG